MTQSGTRKSLSFQGAKNVAAELKRNKETDKPEPTQVPSSSVELSTGQHSNGL